MSALFLLIDLCAALLTEYVYHGHVNSATPLLPLPVLGILASTNLKILAKSLDKMSPTVKQAMRNHSDIDSLSDE